jgi:predicted TIM-barrel fold metal-dependent hydrolase
MQALANRPNVICKISGIIARVTPGWSAATLAPTVNHCLDVFGPDRVVFGGDWPVCTLGASYREWATALREIIAERSERDQRKLLHDNAEQFYQLA